jgi:hypothetical protein
MLKYFSPIATLETQASSLPMAFPSMPPCGVLTNPTIYYILYWMLSSVSSVVEKTVMIENATRLHLVFASLMTSVHYWNCVVSALRAY